MTAALDRVAVPHLSLQVTKQQLSKMTTLANSFQKNTFPNSLFR